MTMGRNIRKSSATFGLYFACIALCYPVLAQETLDIEVAPPKGEIGGDASFNCSVSPVNASVEFLFKGQPVSEATHPKRIKLTTEETTLPEKDRDGNTRKRKTAKLTVHNVTDADAGEYVCLAKLDEVTDNRTMTLDLRFNGRLVNMTKGPLKRNVSDTAHVKLYCEFEVYNKPTEVRWYKIDTEEKTPEPQLRNANPVGLKRINSTYDIHITADDSGTYVCEINDTVANEVIRGEIEVIVYAAPKIVGFNVTAINTTQLYINWTVRDYNSPIESYALLIRELPSENFNLYTREKIGPKNTSFVINGLNKSTEYELKLEVKTKNWTETGKWAHKSIVKTLDKEPVFVPNISIKGFSATSVTIGWPPPPEDIADLIHYYILEARKKDDNISRTAYHQRDSRNLPYMFDNLEPHSTYVFQVCACSDYSKQCGQWSEKMEAATLDGIPGKPSNVTVDCTGGFMKLTWDPPEKPNAEIKGYSMEAATLDGIPGKPSNVTVDCTGGFMKLTWDPPEKPNAEIKGYSIELTGNATYRDRFGTMKEDMWGPLARFMANDSRTARFDDLQPNSNYTVRLSAMTRTRRRGDEETRHCSTPPAGPAVPPRPRWRKILENNMFMFKMYLPRMSERNGPICCYRVHMVRMLPNTDWKNLPPPKDISIIDYEEAHAVQPILGSYITDVFSNDNFPTSSELIMGDNKILFDEKDPVFARDACRRCLLKPRRLPPDLPVPTTTTTSVPTTTEDELFDDTTEDVDVEKEIAKEKVRRSLERDYNNNPMMRDNEEDKPDMKIKPNDGHLDSSSNYTLFVELISEIADVSPMYSDYVNALTPAPTPPLAVPSTPLEVALQVTCAIAAVVLLGMIIFCILQTRRSRKLPPPAHEMNRIQQALRYVVGHIGGRQQLISTVPPDMPPIPKEELAAAYAERQLDSDYGFQKEFEMLPECFPDRTTNASEARENQPKNRYPDIKAYDQTRVKLSQIDSIAGSDYINANYVMGYRERKQFICAQGPTDTTVNDFWRMIWEHGLELIVMLTNLEEYSKVKCSKYWPDEVRGARAFGAITVHHVAEKRYSDYIVRELRITKQPTNADGQPIVENNGIAKRNGDCKEASDSSAPTSPREGKDSSEGRTVRQYHFLMWKDFAAPEHPYSILKFIKRVNEAWSNMVGRPVVVHCSAGVGRTGTLVALDCLLEQLQATGHAAVFNTVAELRRQRNFLVQSLKQYVFVYRALVEYAHYGDTEIPASRLKAAIDRLRNTPEGADKCLMEHEFEKMINSPVAEPVKSCAAGAGEEVRNRNRSPDCLPYDRNRVILTPLPGRDFSTYINASFIEAYDNSEGFIITQDPLPNTIMDFWRMVSEHNVSTIVMLSEIGDGKCPRYWDDGTAQYEHISVQYEESESCPYYTRRQFRVTNNKNGDTCSVRQLQYQGWPTAPGHVPEVTRGLAELADAARLHRPSDHTMLVHCHLGTERSALFVALCILICQLRVERRVDVNTVARKVRSQRARTIDTFLQYEFLHRAILNYAELHNLLEDS